MADTTSAGTPAPAVPAGGARGRTGRDMLLSLGILLVPVLGLVLLWQYLGSGHQVSTVDSAAVVREAKAAGRFPIAVPTGLSSGWRATSAANQNSGGVLTMRIGYVTPGGGFAQLVESNQDSATLLPANLPKGSRPAGTSQLAGHAWSRYTGDRDRQTLALLEQHRTILVIGQAPESELAALARSLRG